MIKSNISFDSNLKIRKINYRDRQKIKKEIVFLTIIE